MLAVKLHKKETAWLGSGSHLVPVVKWDAGKLQIRRWHYLLTASKTTCWPNNQIHFLTLVQIPDNWPVRFVFDYSARSDSLRLSHFHTNEFRALRDWPQEIKVALQEWWDAYEVLPVRRKAGDWEIVVPGGFQTGGLMSLQPELILGKKLPSSSVKWTKDIRLLYRHRGKQHSDAKQREDD